MKTVPIDAVVSKLLAANTDTEIKTVLRKIELQHTKQSYVVPPIRAARLRKFRQLYADMLYEKELAAAKTLVTEQGESLFYKTNDYERRAQFEYGAASILVGQNIRSIAYIGSGPFPATAIFAARNGMKVTLVDRSDEALSLSKRVVSKCGVVCTHVLSEAERLDSLGSFDLTVISGTVGIEESEKLAICQHILHKLSDSGLLCVRTPVREEALLMAPTPAVKGACQADAYIETGTDYMSRTFLARHPETMKGWI